MEKIRTKELHGDFYENGSSRLTVVFGGSDGGIPRVDPGLLEFLTRRSNVLLLAYFGTGALPKRLERIPLEYVLGAIGGLQVRLGAPDRDLTLVGSSKGGELVLVLASRYLNPGTVVACVPGTTVWQGIPHGPGSFLFPRSSWTFGGRELPFQRLGYSPSVFADIFRGIFTSSYESSLRKSRTPGAQIGLEGFGGRVLLLSAEKDKYWPSKKMCEELEAVFPALRHWCLDLEGHLFLGYPRAVEKIREFLEA